jgi:hypothetical protein
VVERPLCIQTANLREVRISIIHTFIFTFFVLVVGRAGNAVVLGVV